MFTIVTRIVGLISNVIVKPSVVEIQVMSYEQTHTYHTELVFVSLILFDKKIKPTLINTSKIKMIISNSKVLPRITMQTKKGTMTLKEYDANFVFNTCFT